MPKIIPSWIPIRDDIHDDPAVYILADRLDTTQDDVVGLCVRWWAWVSRNCASPVGTLDRDDVLSLGLQAAVDVHLDQLDAQSANKKRTKSEQKANNSLTKTSLLRAVAKSGLVLAHPDGDDFCIFGLDVSHVDKIVQRPNFGRIMCDVGWLGEISLPDGTAIVVPNYDRWLSQGQKARLLARRRMALGRAESSPLSRKPLGEQKANKARTKSEQSANKNVDSVRAPLKEKEKEKEKDLRERARARQTHAITLKDGTEYVIPPETLAQWRQRFKNASAAIDGWVQDMIDWCAANPDKRPTSAYAVHRRAIRWIQRELDAAKGSGCTSNEAWLTLFGERNE